MGQVVGSLQTLSQIDTQDLIALCQPLTALNITTFSHLRSYHNKQFNVLCNNQEFLTNYFKKQYYNADPCVQVKPESTDIGQFLVWDVIDCRGKTAAMIQDSADFNFKHVFTIIKKQPDFTEFYHFGTHLIESSINQFYVNNLDLLDRFITFFKRSIGQFKSLSKAYEQRFHANELSTPDCSSWDKWPQLNKVHNQRQDFLKAISMPDKNKLTNREIEYARLLLLGKTAKEIAVHLQQSPRTIEHRVDGLKSKLYAKNKTDLIIKLKDII